MQAYGPVFARVYNLRWAWFARQVAPLIHDYAASIALPGQEKTLLDLCCGSGQLACYFLEKGFRVTGLDLSEAMLHWAGENASPYLETGQARFVQGDAADFQLDEKFNLVVSTYDALNHLDGEAALRQCFACVRRVCSGTFIFDLNTHLGLQRWNSIQVDESSEEAVIITRGIYDGQGDKAWTRISGFLRTPQGLYERFEETAFNTVFTMERVREALLETGWTQVHFAQGQALAVPLAEPEREGRVFIIARG